jgi:hypothetical protein
VIVIGCTLAPFKLSRNSDGALRWLSNIENVIDSASPLPVELFAALEVDRRGLDPYADLLVRQEQLLARGISLTIWTFSIDDGEAIWRTGVRTRRVCAGRNLICDFALSKPGCSHVLFLDSDIVPDPDTIPKLRDLRWPIVGGDVPSYCLTGREVTARRYFHGIDYPAGRRWVQGVEQYGYPVAEHWNTAGFLLVERVVIEHVRWGWDETRGLFDDPWYADQVERIIGTPTLVRKDCIGDHEPLAALEDRGEDVTIR